MKLERAILLIDRLTEITERKLKLLRELRASLVAKLAEETETQSYFYGREGRKS